MRAHYGRIFKGHQRGLHRASTSDYPVINIDVRGHGNSRPTSEFSVKLAAEDIHTIINSEKPGQYLLCGLSMGLCRTGIRLPFRGGRWLYADRGYAVIHTLPQVGKDAARILRGNDEVSLHLEGAEKSYGQRQHLYKTGVAACYADV